MLVKNRVRDISGDRNVARTGQLDREASSYRDSEVFRQHRRTERGHCCSKKEEGSGQNKKSEEDESEIRPDTVSGRKM